MTPEGVTWEPYDKSYADNEPALTNNKGEMLPPRYELKEFVTEEDYPKINLVMGMDDAVNRHDKDAVIAVFAVQDVDFDEEGIGINLRMSEVAAAAVKPFSVDWNPAYESMPVGQDHVGTIISSVSNTLDPLSFYDTLESNAAISKFKMFVGATSIIPPEKLDGLWTDGEPWYVTIDISTLKTHPATNGEQCVHIQ